MGGTKADARVKSFLGTLSTKIFHANADIETNRYASELIGEDYFEELTRTSTAAGQFSSSKSKSLRLSKVVRPEEFRIVTRAHVIAWRDDLERRVLARAAACRISKSTARARRRGFCRCIPEPTR